ncbi:AMP-binding protein [Nocardia xishanensis]|uniref:AMP-binding protein n=1 Tax=Nocardia xishanensis TaxID=238964 RepID=A0ABW7X047_9NOCA
MVSSTIPAVLRVRPDTMRAAFQANVARYADALALRTFGGEQTITWREYGARVRSIATGLAAIGIRPGGTVAPMPTNRPEFHRMGLAATSHVALSAAPDVLAEIERGVTAANGKLSPAEQIKKSVVLGEVWEPGGDCLTATGKLRRAPIASRYTDTIEAMYT